MPPEKPHFYGYLETIADIMQVSRETPEKCVTNGP